jgi:DNA-binding PadR family transcriptional regulator
MQYTLTISQTKAQEWGLNAQQALLFAFVYECPSWAKPMKNEKGVFYALSKAKIVEELPILTDKPDTAYRLLKQLEQAGVIELSHTAGITLVRLTDKGRTWNRGVDGSEKYPNDLGKISDVGRKNIREGSEKSPTNQDTSNQDTNQEGASAPVAKSTRKVSVPVQAIVDLFNETLPELPTVVLINKGRQATVKARWNDSEVHQDLDFWRDFFESVRASDFLMGKTQGRDGKPFRCSFDWLLCPSNFVKVVEGNYHA